jgi:hypothetical protein
MRFKYAQERVRQLKGSLEPTESSVVIDWPTMDQKGKELKIKQIRSVRSKQIELRLRKCESHSIHLQG